MSVYRANGLLLLNGRSYVRDEVVEIDGLSRHRLKQLLACRKLRREKPSEAPVEASEALSSEGATPAIPELESAAKRSRKRRGASHYR